MFARWLALLVLAGVVLVITPVAMLFVLPLASSTSTPVLPRWLAWFNTPDDPGPAQGMYEPQVRAVYDRFGWAAKTWYWLGVRNQMNGLFYALAPTAARGQPIWSSSPHYPQTKGPFLAGKWLATACINDRWYFEFAAVWPWSATKCGQFRMGWKLEPLIGSTGPVMFCLEFRPYITRDSVT